MGFLLGMTSCSLVQSYSTFCACIARDPTKGYFTHFERYINTSKFLVCHFTDSARYRFNRKANISNSHDFIFSYFLSLINVNVVVFLMKKQTM